MPRVRAGDERVLELSPVAADGDVEVARVAEARRQVLRQASGSRRPDRCASRRVERDAVAEDEEQDQRQDEGDQDAARIAQDLQRFLAHQREETHRARRGERRARAVLMPPPPAPSCSTSAMKASSIVGSGLAALGDARLQLVRRAERDRLAAIDQRDAVAVFGLVHEVRGDQHGDALLDQAVDVRPELAPRDRIDAGGRLVEEQHGGLVHHGAGQRQALLEARAAVARPASTRSRPRSNTSTIRAMRSRLCGALEPIDAGEEVEVLLAVRSP